jgi:AcrR family transcriptional regulator
VSPTGQGASPVSSRDRLVEAAIALIREHHRGRSDARDVFAFLNPRSVAERAGVSRGLIYHHWGEADSDGSEAFDRFLSTVTDELWNRVTGPEDLGDLADLLPDELSDVVGALANYELGRFVEEDDGTGRAILALSLYGIGSRADTPESVAKMSKLYESLLPKLGLELLPPLCHDDLAFALMALLDGFVLHLTAMEPLIARRHRWRPR